MMMEKIDGPSYRVLFVRHRTFRFICRGVVIVVAEAAIRRWPFNRFAFPVMVRRIRLYNFFVQKNDKGSEINCIVLNGKGDKDRIRNCNKRIIYASIRRVSPI